ncbi:hypothetical protein GYMLUDRAFT_240954 [Collybiopsis luxurians FD-317 M1]|nr:hypothetical protein GYMLUDRAFT_240954 [Collybiopsis luxurians FD-317 M1]
MEKSWNFVASEIGPNSFGHAQRIISANRLHEWIQLVQPNPASLVLAPLFLAEEATFEFNMCNSPFYSSVENVARSAEVRTGADVEMITPGDESPFVGKMAERAGRLGNDVGEATLRPMNASWYTGILGKFEGTNLDRDPYSIFSFFLGVFMCLSDQEPHRY